MLGVLARCLVVVIEQRRTWCAAEVFNDSRGHMSREFLAEGPGSNPRDSLVRMTTSAGKRETDLCHLMLDTQFGELNDRPRLLSLDATHRLCRGAADHAGLLIVELDRQRHVGAQDVTVWCLWRRPKATFCPATMIAPALQARRFTRIG